MIWRRALRSLRGEKESPMDRAQALGPASEPRARHLTAVWLWANPSPSPGLRVPRLYRGTNLSYQVIMSLECASS